MRGFMTCSPHIIFWVITSMHGGEKCIQAFGDET